VDGHEKSDGPIVPGKPRNNAGRPAADAVEGRGPTEGNPSRQNAVRTQSRAAAHSALERVRQAARKDRKTRFTALLHHVTIERLRSAYWRLKRRAAAGVDGVTWEQYGEHLEENLQSLHARLHQGAYRARPSRRVYIPKPDGRQRPLGIAALEDKLLQSAVVEVLNAIYEEDFLGFSYGFRPHRAPHDALDALAVGIERRRVNWVLDADIRGFFDAIDHGWLVRFLEHRIGDRRVLRLIQKWLAAGVMEDGSWSESEAGTPQGATISPLLANVYLHYVFDLWVHQWRKRQALGDVIVVRYADDCVVGFQHRREAERFLADLGARLRRFGLELHAEKTRLLEFGRYSQTRRQERGLGTPEVFSFLGFTHMCAGWGRNFLLVRQTDKRRLRAKLHAVKTELQLRRHHPIPAQGVWLQSVVRGHFAYYAVPTNIKALGAFRTEVERSWYRALRRRSQKDSTTWEQMSRRRDRWLPRPRISHPWPEKRFDVTTRGRSRMR
jgi:group II intron reverse transcriptase/maturase